MDLLAKNMLEENKHLEKNLKEIKQKKDQEEEKRYQNESRQEEIRQKLLSLKKSEITLLTDIKMRIQKIDTILNELEDKEIISFCQSIQKNKDKNEISIGNSISGLILNIPFPKNEELNTLISNPQNLRNKMISIKTEMLSENVKTQNLGEADKIREIIHPSASSSKIKVKQTLKTRLQLILLSWVIDTIKLSNYQKYLIDIKGQIDEVFIRHLLVI